ncbi:SDR family oxidoreductase [Viridibacterium curvum]|uniref:dTDP-4-dehydrorhamnose reductase n=1 Tax=Viridibacterium curvum TaxID=1101404 RepID=A0ABP9QL65_9RHOO
MLIGGDGLIGRALAQTLQKSGVQVATTSRKGSEGSIALDLSQSIRLEGLPDCDTLYLCAAISRFAACEQDPALAKRVNVDANIALAEHFLSRGAHVVFLSSNAVFNGQHEAPAEDAPMCPISLYGSLKADAEAALTDIARQYGAGLSIVRMTKVFSAQVPLLSGWLTKLRANQVIDAFSDMTLSPISLAYAIEGLKRCGDRKLGGIAHLSGGTECSYAEFATALARSVGRDTNLVSATPSPQSSAPVHNRLAMTHTATRLAMTPPGLDSTLRDLLQAA